MRLTHEPIGADLIDMELIELKFIFDRSELLTWIARFFSHSLAHHDNRDFEILANYQPVFSESFFKQTQLFGKSEGVSLPILGISAVPTMKLAWMAQNIPQGLYSSIPARQWSWWYSWREASYRRSAQARCRRLKPVTSQRSSASKNRKRTLWGINSFLWPELYSNLPSVDPWWNYLCRFHSCPCWLAWALSRLQSSATRCRSGRSSKANGIEDGPSSQRHWNSIH